MTSPRAYSAQTVQAGEPLGSPSGPCVAWPQTWPLPTTATKLAPAQIQPHYRGARSLYMHACIQSCVLMQRKRHPFVANDFCLSHSPALLCTSAWAYCITDHYTGVGEGKRGLLSGGDVQPVVLSATYSPIHVQNKKLSITQCCRQNTALRKNLPGFSC